MSEYTRNSIRVKLLGLAIVPVIVVALVLGYYLITARIHDTKFALIDKGELIANNFAPAVEFALFTQNIPLLQLLSQPILRDPEVISVTIYDQHRSQVLYVESDQYPAGRE